MHEQPYQIYGDRPCRRDCYRNFGIRRRNNTGTAAGLFLQRGRRSHLSLFPGYHASNLPLFSDDPEKTGLSLLPGGTSLFAGWFDWRHSVCDCGQKSFPCLAPQTLWLHPSLERIQMFDFLTVIVSALLGILSGLGVGGGSLLIVWLTLVQGAAYSDAKFINLLFFLPPALISSIANLIRKKLPIKSILPAALAGSLSAIAFSLLSGGWDVGILRKLFGWLLLYTAFREIRYKKQAAK